MEKFFDLQMFAATFEDGKITLPLGSKTTLTLTGNSIKKTSSGAKISAGTLKISGLSSTEIPVVVSKGSATVNASTGKITLAKNTSVTMPTSETQGVIATALNKLTATMSFDSKGNLTFKDSDTDSVQIAFYNGTTQTSANTIQTKGSVTLSSAGVLTVAKGSEVSSTINNTTFTAKVVSDISTKLSITDGVFNIASADNKGKVAITAARSGKTVFGGTISVTNGSVSINPANGDISLNKNTKTNITVGNISVDLTATGKLSANLSFADGMLSLSDNDKDSVNLVIKNTKTSATIFSGAVRFKGKVSIDSEGNFALDNGTEITATLNNGMTITATAGDDNHGTIKFVDGAFQISGNNSIDVAVARDSSTVFSGNVSVYNGSVSYNPTTGAFTLAKGSATVLTVGNSKINLTPSADLTTTIKYDGDKLTISNSDDGVLQAIVMKDDYTVFSGKCCGERYSYG